MKTHVLNCATIRPYLLPIDIATCCLLVELEDGLLLVDTGLGTKDHECPSSGIRLFRRLTRLFCPPEQTALNQVIGLGFTAEDVQHIVMTHLHIDHAGGISDFPEATVHVSETEYMIAQSGGKLRGLVYIADHWAHGPNWQLYRQSEANNWFGFNTIRVLSRSTIQVLLVPLPGHTREHCGVAVGDGKRWILHCGDAIALGALKTKPDSIMARPLGPNFPMLHGLAQSQEGIVKLIPSHVLLDEVPVMNGAG